MECHLRPATASDHEFLYAVYSRTMREVIEATWGWDEAWQRSDFDRRFSEHAASIIECDGLAVGGVLLESTPDSIYIHELQVLPEYQGRGIGTTVVRQVLDEAANRGAAVLLSVVPANPRARQLYERLGFEVTHIEAPFLRMRCNPPGTI